jgi:hypothetical protein
MSKAMRVKKQLKRKPQRQAKAKKTSARRKKGKAAVASPRCVGRPSLYRPEYCEQAAKLCQLGATDIEIADFFDVNKVTLYRWQAQYPEFCNSIKTAKEAADERVERSLYQKATGYTHDSEKLFYDAQSGAVVRAPVREHIPPSDTAMIFWLKNRRPKEWRDKQDINHNHAHLNLTETPVSIQQAQDMFRQARNMTAAELAEQFRVIEGNVEARIPDAEPVAEDADSEDVSDVQSS